MYSYAPTELEPACPLVLVLHGCKQSVQDYVRGVGWSALADHYGFAIVAPEQRKANNVNGRFNWFNPPDVARYGGEVESILEMVATAAEAFSSDRTRIYVTGLSAGGAMTSALLATALEIFAGGAIIAGLPYGAASNVQEALASMRRAPKHGPQKWGDAVRRASGYNGPWPRISVWHGDADQTVSMSNAEAVVAQWRNVHGLTKSAHQEVWGRVSRRTWTNDEEEALIEAYTLKGFGHGAPIKIGDGKHCCGQPGPYILDAGICSTLRIAEFFGLSPTPGALNPFEGQDRRRPAAKITQSLKQVISGALNRAKRKLMRQNP